MALHELAHVDLDERVLAPEHELGECLGQLGLPDAGRAEEDERADRSLRILESCPGPADGLRHDADRLFLADDPTVERLLHVEQALRLFLGDAGDRDPGPHRDDLGDLLFVDRRLVARDLRLPLRALGVDRLAGGRLGLAQGRGLLVFLVVDRRVLFLGDPLEVLLGLAQGRRRGRMAQADARGSLVDQVDRLVRQVAVGDVADRQVGRGLDRLIGDGDLVMLLVTLADAEQDVDRLLEGRLLDHDRLEAALEGGVALDVLAVLVEGRRADALQLAAGERRLEDVGGIDGTLRGAGADQGVELVDEEDRVVRVAQLLDDLLEPLLELAAVLGAGNERPDVEGQDALVEQRLGDVAGDDPMGEALGDRGLADAGLADQGRVVLGPSRQDLDDPLDLLLSADDGIQLSCTGGVGEVDAELVDGRGLARPLGLGRGAGGRALRQDADDLVADLVEVDAERLEDTGGDPLALADEAEEQVLRADVVVSEAASLVDRQLDDPLRARGEPDLADDGAVTTADDELDGRPDLGQLDVHVLEDARRHTLALADEAQEQMLRADVVVVEPLRLVLSQCQDLARAIRELVEAIHRVERLFPSPNAT